MNFNVKGRLYLKIFQVQCNVFFFPPNNKHLYVHEYDIVCMSMLEPEYIYWNSDTCHLGNVVTPHFAVVVPLMPMLPRPPFVFDTLDLSPTDVLRSPKTVSSFRSPRASPQTRESDFLVLVFRFYFFWGGGGGRYETMSNCSQNCWIDCNSAALCFEQLFHIRVENVCPICEGLSCPPYSVYGKCGLVPNNRVYMYHVFHWLA